MFKIVVILFLLLLLGGVITKRVVRILAIALLIGLLIREIVRLNVGYVSFSSCNMVLSSQQLPISEAYEQDIPIDKDCELTLTSVFGGAIDVIGWDKPFARLETVKRAGAKQDLKKLSVAVKTDAAKEGGLAKRVDIMADSEGSTWTVGDGWFSIRWSNYNWSGPVPCLEHKLFVPKDKIKTISLRLRAGAVDVKELRAEALRVHVRSGSIVVQKIDGDVEVSSRSGKVEISRVDGSATVDVRYGQVIVDRVDENVSIQSRNGSIVIRDVKGQAAVETRSGLVTMRSVDGNVRVRARNSSVVLDDVASSVDVSTRSGMITVRRAKDAQGKVSCASRSGSIIVKDNKGNVLAQGRGQIVVK